MIPLDKPVGHLSVAEQQLVEGDCPGGGEYECRVLVFDEPTSSFDAIGYRPVV